LEPVDFDLVTLRKRLRQHEELRPQLGVSTPSVEFEMSGRSVVAIDQSPPTVRVVIDQRHGLEGWILGAPKITRHKVLTEGVIAAHPDIEELPNDEDATPNDRNRCEFLNHD